MTASRSRRLALAAALATLLACPARREGVAEVRIALGGALAGITAIRLAVTAPDLTRIEAALPVDGSVATLQIPAGRDRTFSGEAFAGAVRTHAGQTLVAELVAGQRTSVDLRLLPLPDTTPPAVVSTTPPEGTTGVDVAVAPSATLSEPLDPASCDSRAFTLRVSGGAAVDGAVACAGAVVTFAPAAALAPGTAHQATLTTGLRDLSGNALARDHAWQFTTASGPARAPRFAYGGFSRGKLETFAVTSGGGLRPELSEQVVNEISPNGTSAVRALAALPSGRFAYTVLEYLDGGPTELWKLELDATSGRVVTRELAALPGRARWQHAWLFVSSDERFLFAVIDGDQVLWNEPPRAVYSYAIDAGTGALTLQSTYSEFFPSVRAVALHPSGRYLYLPHAEGLIVIGIDDAGALSFVEDRVMLTGWVEDLAFHPAGGVLYAAAGGYETQLALIDPVTGTVAVEPAVPSALPTATALAVHPAGTVLFVGHDDGVLRARALDPLTGALLPAAAEASGGPRFEYLVVDPDGSVVVGSGSGMVCSFRITGDSRLVVPAGAARATEDAYGLALISGARPAVREARFLYSANGDDTLSVHAVSPATGALTEVAGSPFATGVKPSSLAVDPLGRYAWVGSGAGQLASFSLDPSTGAPTPLGVTALSGTAILDLATEPAGRFLFAAHADPVLGGVVETLRIDPAGAVTSLVLGTIDGSVIERLGGDVLGTFLFGGPSFTVDPVTGTLWGWWLETERLGAGPMALHPSGRFLYAASPAGSVSTYLVWPSGWLARLEQRPLDAAAIVADPLGRFVWIAERTGTDTNGLWTYAVAADGTLTPVAQAPNSIPASEALGVEPTGRFLYVGSGGVHAYGIDDKGMPYPLPGSPFPGARAPLRLSITSVFR